MKTIEEAAAAYAAEERTTRSEHAAFIASAEFTQKWISLDEELPPETPDELIGLENCTDDDNVLVKDLLGNVYIGFYDSKKKGFWLSDRFLKNKKVSAWRPIEFKY